MNIEKRIEDLRERFNSDRFGPATHVVLGVEEWRELTKDFGNLSKLVTTVLGLKIIRSHHKSYLYVGVAKDEEAEEAKWTSLPPCTGCQKPTTGKYSSGRSSHGISEPSRALCHKCFKNQQVPAPSESEHKAGSVIELHSKTQKGRKKEMARILEEFNASKPPLSGIKKGYVESCIKVAEGTYVQPEPTPDCSTCGVPIPCKYCESGDGIGCRSHYEPKTCSNCKNWDSECYGQNQGLCSTIDYSCTTADHFCMNHRMRKEYKPAPPKGSEGLEAYWKKRFQNARSLDLQDVLAKIKALEAELIEKDATIELLEISKGSKAIIDREAKIARQRKALHSNTEKIRSLKATVAIMAESQCGNLRAEVKERNATISGLRTQLEAAKTEQGRRLSETEAGLRRELHDVLLERDEARTEPGVITSARDVAVKLYTLALKERDEARRERDMWHAERNSASIAQLDLTDRVTALKRELEAKGNEPKRKGGGFLGLFTGNKKIKDERDLALVRKDFCKAQRKRNAVKSELDRALKTLDHTKVQRDQARSERDKLEVISAKHAKEAEFQSRRADFNLELANSSVERCHVVRGQLASLAVKLASANTSLENSENERLSQVADLTMELKTTKAEKFIKDILDSPFRGVGPSPEPQMPLESMTDKELRHEAAEAGWKLDMTACPVLADPSWRISVNGTGFFKSQVLYLKGVSLLNCLRQLVALVRASKMDKPDRRTGPHERRADSPDGMNPVDKSVQRRCPLYWSGGRKTWGLRKDDRPVASVEQNSDGSEKEDVK